MIPIMRSMLVNQFEASLRTLGLCVARCPDELWDVRVGNHPFSQVAFHTVFFADYYLGLEPESLRKQAFHTSNPTLFGDYEQLQDREPVAVYERPPIEAYLIFCHAKAVATIAAETEESLRAPARFHRRDMSRVELYVYNIRHIQHHAAQMSLRLRLDASVEIPWIGAGWGEG